MVSDPAVVRSKRINCSGEKQKLTIFCTDRGGDRGRGDRGRGRRGARRGANKNEEKEWQPVTKLGRLVKAGKIKSMEEIYLHSLPIKEYQIVDFFLPKLKDEVMKVRATKR